MHAVSHLDSIASREKTPVKSTCKFELIIDTIAADLKGDAGNVNFTAKLLLDDWPLLLELMHYSCMLVFLLLRSLVDHSLPLEEPHPKYHHSSHISLPLVLQQRKCHFTCAPSLHTFSRMRFTAFFALIISRKLSIFWTAQDLRAVRF